MPPARSRWAPECAPLGLRTREPLKVWEQVCPAHTACFMELRLAAVLMGGDGERAGSRLVRSRGKGVRPGRRGAGPGKLYGARAVCLVGPGGLGKGAGGDSGRCAWKTGTLEPGAGAVALQFL